MRAKLLLRIAAGLMIFHMLGHTLGHMNWKKAVEPQKQEVIRQMTEHKFPFMGQERSMGDYYEGYGWAGTIALALMAAMLWLASGAVHESRSLALKTTLTLSLSLGGWCVVEFLFFFPFAASTTLLAAAMSLIAAWQLYNPAKN